MAKNRQLKPIECHDIICFLSRAVISGGVRRGSLVSLFSLDDEEMLYCKDEQNFNFRFINTQRALANNSVVLKNGTIKFSDFKKIFELNKDNFGDPGFIFVDDLNCGTNPCGEIGINPVLKIYDEYTESQSMALDHSQSVRRTFKKKTGFGFCNLVEINVAACNNEQEFYDACRAASFIATLQASYTNFPYLGKITEDITKRDALIGVSITGMMDNPWIFNPNILSKGANLVVKINTIISKKIGINKARRCTCIKPSGTGSLELGCVSSGIHPHHAKYYFRRITADPMEPAAKLFIKHNPQMVEKKSNGDLCITFPVMANGITLNDIDAIDFINKINMVYEHWVLTGGNNQEITHNVSCTIVVEPDEWDAVIKYIWDKKMRGVTVFPVGVDDSIPFCPRMAVVNQSQIDEFNHLVRNYKKIDYTTMREYSDSSEKGAGCDGDTCGINYDAEKLIIGGDGCRVFNGQQKNKTFKVNDLKFKVIKQFKTHFIAKRITN
jgi:ribonucleoside-diphosphate reductase alpha chain